MNHLTHKLPEMRTLAAAAERSLESGRTWLQGQILPGGRPTPLRQFKYFGKPAWGLRSGGASDATLTTMLDHVAREALRPTGDFYFEGELPPGGGGYSIYPALYCLLAAVDVGHPLASDERVKTRLVQHQSEATGAVYSTIGLDPADVRPTPVQASLVTATSIHLFLRMGMVDRALRAAEYLMRIVEANRVPMKREGIFYTQATLEGELIVGDRVPANHSWSHALSNRKPKQEFWQTGAIMAALGKLAGHLLAQPSPDRALARRLLDHALILLDFEMTMLPEGYEWPQKCKIAWGGGELLQTCVRHLPAGKSRLELLYRITRNTLVSTFFDSQRADGGWGGEHYPLVDDAPEFAFDYKLLRGLRNAPLEPFTSTTSVWATPEELTGEFLGETAIGAAGVRALLNRLEK